MADDLTPREQDEEEALAGLILITIDGRRLSIPVLKMGAARVWRERMKETFTALASMPGDTPEANEAMADATRDLVLAYDETGVLGGREWLDAHATDEDLDNLYNAVVGKSFRFVQSPLAIVLAILRQVAVSARANSSSGASPTGTSAPTSSPSGSPTPNSTSSGHRRKRASHESATIG